MLIGVPKEIKSNEHRIGLTPAGVRELVHNGHQVMVQRDGAQTIGFDNSHYEQAGAEIVENELLLHALRAHSSQHPGRDEIVAVDHVVLPHNGHWGQYPGNPVLVGYHPAPPVEGDVHQTIMQRSSLGA